MDKRLIGEFMGTLVLVLLGNGIVANVVLNKSKGQASGWMVITSGWAFAVMAGVFTAIACGSPDAHINPAVTIAFAVSSGDFSKFVPYFLAQLLGAAAGSILVWLHFMPHWAVTPDAGGKLACFSTGPAIRSLGSNLLSEALGTFMLVLGIASIVSKNTAPAGLAPGIAPLLIGGVIWAIAAGMGGTTGFAINPARDLGPRIMHAILPIAGKGGSDWGYAAVPVVGGLVGGVLAGLFIQALHL
jgi:glycerol uptake facilitator protein